MGTDARRCADTADIDGPRPAAAEPVLARLRRGLERLYGDRIDRIVLFGSPARGEAHDESDEVALFLHGCADRWDAVPRIAPLVTDILTEMGAFRPVMPFRADAWHERTPSCTRSGGRGCRWEAGNRTLPHSRHGTVSPTPG